MFSVPPQTYPTDASIVDTTNVTPLVQKDIKNAKYIRRLRDFEVLMLLLSNVKTEN